jgi:hypothetical protein
VSEQRVCIVPCSGIGKTYGSVTREAAYAAEELRPAIWPGPGLIDAEAYLALMTAQAEEASQ